MMEMISWSVIGTAIAAVLGTMLVSMVLPWLVSFLSPPTKKESGRPERVRLTTK